MSGQTQNGYCRKCNSPFHYSIPRGWLLKGLFGFLPIRKYFCARCLETRYTWGKEYEA